MKRMHLKVTCFALVYIFDRLTTPFSAWARSLYNSRSLFSKKGINCMSFTPYVGMNSYFYKTQYLNLVKFGRNGISPIVGMGHYHLSKWFHLSSFSSLFYTNWGAIVTLSGMLIWVASHSIWIMYDVKTLWIFYITFILFFSTTTYSLAFVRMNYQILGWILLPSFLYYLHIGQFQICALLLFALSYISLTVTGLICPIILAYAISSSEYNAAYILLSYVKRRSIQKIA